MDKLKANMAAAKMLYPNAMLTPQGNGISVSVRHMFNSVSFNLFTNPSDLVEVVKCLGERHKYAVTPVYSGWMVGHCDVPYVREEVYFKTCDTYEEAVAQACIATQEGV